MQCLCRVLHDRLWIRFYSLPEFASAHLEEVRLTHIPANYDNQRVVIGAMVILVFLFNNNSSKKN